MIARIARLLRAPLGVGLAYLVIVNAVAMGIRAPQLGVLAPLPPGVAVDYSALHGDVSPLQPEFIRSVLGDTAPAAFKPAVPVRAQTRRGPSPLDDVAHILDEHHLTNDRVTDARSIPRPPFTARTDTSQATRTAEDPGDCGSVGGTVWYRYRTSLLDGLIANTFGTKRSVSLGVYERTGGSMKNIGCDTDLNGNAVIVFTAKPGRDYYFQVATPTGGGPLVFSLEMQGRTTLESVSPAGDPGDSVSAGPAVSGNGRIVAFGSLALNIVPGLSDEPCITHEPYAGSPSNVAVRTLSGLNTCTQIFARDRLTGRTVLVTASPEGHPGNSHTGRSGQYNDDRTQHGGVSLAHDGRYVSFASDASNLVRGDTNGFPDVFVRDLWKGTTERVSIDSQERQAARSPGPGSSLWASMSADGRFVVFQSTASDLVPEDTNFAPDVFVRDRAAGTTTRVSVSSSGEQAELLSDLSAFDNQAPHTAFPMIPCISADGRYVAFRSAASNLVPGDTNQMADIFVHDRLTRITELVSIGHDGRQADLHSQTWPGCVSGNGRFVVFTSRATNLVDGDTNNLPDVFVRDRLLGVTRRVNVPSDGRQSETGDALFRARVAVISADGRYIAFQSSASDLVEGDQNAHSDIFIHDLVTGTTTRVSSKPGGGEFTDTDTYNPSISADGRFVAFDAAPAGVYLRPLESVAPAQVYVHERSRSGL